MHSWDCYTDCNHAQLGLLYRLEFCTSGIVIQTVTMHSWDCCADCNHAQLGLQNRMGLYTVQNTIQLGTLHSSDALYLPSQLWMTCTNVYSRFSTCSYLHFVSPYSLSQPNEGKSLGLPRVTSPPFTLTIVFSPQPDSEDPQKHWSYPARRNFLSQLTAC